MSFKDPLRVSLNGDVAKAAPHVRTARTLAHGLLTLNGASGASTGRREIITPDGTRVEVMQRGNDVSAKITAGGRLIEEVISVYFSSADGLRVVDLGRKSETQHITGLEDYEVDGVSIDGRYVYMTGGGITVRVDRVDLSAFGHAYEVDTASGAPEPIGTAIVTNMDVSPDGTRAVARFDQTIASGGGVLDGLGGLLVINAETLEPVRPAIRMSYYREAALAWDPNSERFFAGASLGTDPGDVASLTVTTVTTDFIAQYSREGVLINAKQVATWGFTPNAGFARSVTALAVNPAGTRLYAWIETTFLDPAVPGGKLVAYDITDDAWPQVAELVFNSSPPALVAHPELLINYGGTRCAIWFNGHTDGISVAEVDLTDDNLTLIHRTYDPRYTMGSPANLAEPAHNLRVGPRSRLGQPPDNRRFFYSKHANMLHGYRNFDVDPTYELDLTQYDPKTRYALAITAARVYERNEK